MEIENARREGFDGYEYELSDFNRTAYVYTDEPMADDEIKALMWDGGEWVFVTERGCGTECTYSMNGDSLRMAI